jgi:catechol 2,3-dioxygenase
MGLQRVGHVVIKMRDIDKAKAFYGGVLGMTVSDESDIGVFFRFGDYHHDIAVFRTSPEADLPKKDQVGLVHVAVVADSVQTVKAMYERCKAEGVEIVGTTDHGMTKSLYIKDPEGNTIEIYAEVPEFNWREHGFAGKAKPFDFEAVPAAV